MPEALLVGVLLGTCRGQVLDAQAGAGCHARKREQQVDGVEEIDLGSGPVQTSTWETIIVGMPLKVSEWVNSNGDVLKMHIDSGSGLIEGERLCVAARPGRAKRRPR